MIDARSYMPFYCGAICGADGGHDGRCPHGLGLGSATLDGPPKRATCAQGGRRPVGKTTYNALIMGASYGSLLATKLAMAGHSVKLVCLPAEADAINTKGARVRLSVKGRKDLVEIDSRTLPGKI